ncbi:DUF305 domain-containing protein [Dactylosporangium fulvum]|uniref:DUF305 domain-containing protein n=1 Tax=Dactylosporangium fulvum TaxID=53359 RepID=A0ABY5VPH6_9ACTN|nr:DUF305 domain-containing protein [Dactylosporangium fulvum]UWP78689.1 DUF305 domain-containing protein [Dactylosporangium fulvum]
MTTVPTPDPGRPGRDATPAVSTDIWRRAGAVAVVLVAAIVVVVLWARPAHEPAPPGAAASSAPAPVSSLNPTDVAFLQLMISLDNSALPLFEILAADPALATLAGTGADGHRAELAALRAALTAGGAVEDPGLHAGHDLPGMVVDADLAAVRGVPAGQRSAKALEVLREHLTGTTALATNEGKAGADPATKAAAAQILDAHTKLLSSLPAM